MVAAWTPRLSTEDVCWTSGVHTRYVIPGPCTELLRARPGEAPGREARRPPATRAEEKARPAQCSVKFPSGGTAGGALGGSKIEACVASVDERPVALPHVREPKNPFRRRSALRILRVY